LERKAIIISSDRTIAAVSQQKKTLRVKKPFKVKINDQLRKECHFCIWFSPMGIVVRSDIGELGYEIAEVEFQEKCDGRKAPHRYYPDFAIAVEEHKESKEN
jgi:hypothetical protein